MRVKINPERVAVDQEYFWQPIESCPINIKVQLLSIGGLPSYGKYNGQDDFWVYWAPIPKIPKHLKK